MKKILRYPFLCLLVLSSTLAAPFMWQQMGLLPALPWQEPSGAPQLEAPVNPTEPPVQLPPAALPTEAPPPATEPPVLQLPPYPIKPSMRPDDADEEIRVPVESKPEKPEDPFANALFVGDSRTVGIGKYARIEGAEFFASTGMSVYQVFSKAVDMTHQKGVLLEDLLAERSYDRIFVMLGINELGFNTERTVKTYGQVIARLQELQPQAYIHIQANMHVTKAKSDSDKLYNNTNIDRLNTALSSLANHKSVFFMDVNPAFDDENGGLQDDMTGDGVHLYSKHYTAWADWLRENTPA